MCRKTIHWILWPAFLCWVVGVAAQEQRFVADYFREEIGLTVSTLNDIQQDRTGFLWLATPEGLTRYDGYSFKHFQHKPGDSTSISHNHVLCVTEDPQGNIWAGLARAGVSCYNRATGKFRNYRFTETLKLKTASVHRIFFDREGRIWLGVSSNGIFLLDPVSGDFKQYDLLTPQFTPHLNEFQRKGFNSSYNFWQDEDGKLWCATIDDLYLFDPNTGQATPKRANNTKPDASANAQAYALYPEGDYLWVGGWGSGLRRYNRKTGDGKQFMFNYEGLPGSINIINSIAPKSADELWVSSADCGLGVFNKKTERFFFFGRDSKDFPEIPDRSAGQLFQDKQGNLWLNHSNQLLRLQQKAQHFRFTPIRPKKLLPDPSYAMLTAVFEDRDGRYCFSGLVAGEGLFVIDKRTGKMHNPDVEPMPGTGAFSRAIMGFCQSADGNIWVLGRHQIYRFNPETMRLEKPPQPPVYSPALHSNEYTQIAADPEGKLWIGSSASGIFHYDPRNGATVHYLPNEQNPGAIPTNVVGAIGMDGQGRAWFGSRGNTAYGYFHTAENRFVRLDVNGNETSELATHRLNNFFTDAAGNIWAGTESGVLHFDCSGERPRLIKKYTIADGLPSDYVVNGVADSRGRLWLVTPLGLCRLAPETGKISVYGRRDGLPKNTFNIGKLLDGRLFMLAEYGFYTFNPDSLQPVRHHEPLVLTSFKVDDQERYSGSNLKIERTLIVPAEARFFSLEFAALDFVAPEEIQYEYRLEGFDEQWSSAEGQRFVNYTNIPTGRYTFKVKQKGAPESEALSVPLWVQVPFYKAAWFWAVMLASAAALGLVLFRNRQRHMQQLTELTQKAQLLEKEKAVVMYESLKQQLNPHFLFNSLTSLGSLIQIDPKSATRFLENLSKTYRYILKSSERELVPLTEELRFAEAFVNLQKTRFEEGLIVNFDVEDAHFHRKVVPVTLQNLLENAIKHNIIDTETPLVVDIFVEDNYLVVRNNLQKKKFVESSNRKGLAHLQSFYQYLSDRNIEIIEDAQNFTIKIPLL